MYFDNCKTYEEVVEKFTRFSNCVKGDAEIIAEIKAAYTAKTAQPTPVSDTPFPERLAKLLAWASTQPNFDTKFLVSLQEKLDKGWSLSEKQIAAAENIITRFKLQF